MGPRSGQPEKAKRRVDEDVANVEGGSNSGERHGESEGSGDAPLEKGEVRIPMFNGVGEKGNGMPTDLDQTLDSKFLWKKLDVIVKQ